MHVICVIPARFASKRFPGKSLAKIAGKPMLQWVYEGIQSSRLIDEIVIATDDERILKEVDHFMHTHATLSAKEKQARKSFKAIMTTKELATGTDRVREAVKKVDLKSTANLIINVQGDEPLVEGESLDRLIKEFTEAPHIEMATLSEQFDSAEEVFDPNNVKVVTDREGFALYFSRSPIPYFKAGKQLKADFAQQLKYRPDLIGHFLKHQGIYAYKRDTLFRLGTIKGSPYEEMEGLEQLRALEAGIRIKVIISGFRSIGVDTPEDIPRVEAILKNRK